MVTLPAQTRPPIACAAGSACIGSIVPDPLLAAEFAYRFASCGVPRAEADDLGEWAAKVMQHVEKHWDRSKA